MEELGNKQTYRPTDWHPLALEEENISNFDGLTCLGVYTFGCTHLQISPERLEALRDHITISPGGNNNLILNSDDKITQLLLRWKFELVSHQNLII